jgi:hypothetical protein
MGDRTSFTRTDAAREAGMSKHQQVQATRIANLPTCELSTDLSTGTFFFLFLFFYFRQKISFQCNALGVVWVSNRGSRVSNRG